MLITKRVYSIEIEIILSNIQILFFEHLGERKEERNLRIALIDFLVMRFIQISAPLGLAVTFQ